MVRGICEKTRAREAQKEIRTVLAWRAKTRDTSPQAVTSRSETVQLLRRARRRGRKASRVAMMVEKEGGRGGGRKKRRRQLTRQAVPARKKQNKATQGSSVIVPEFVTLREREKPLFARSARGWARSPRKASHLPNRARASLEGARRGRQADDRMEASDISDSVVNYNKQWCPNRRLRAYTRNLPLW